MNRAEYDLWLQLVSDMLGRLDVLSRALENGTDCRDPRVAVETSEIRALDLLGFRLLRELFPEVALRRIWHLHKDDECSPIQSSVVRLQSNRNTFRLLCRQNVVWVEAE
jgi:hypothetical protein